MGIALSSSHYRPLHLLCRECGQAPNRPDRGPGDRPRSRRPVRVSSYRARQTRQARQALIRSARGSPHAADVWAKKNSRNLHQFRPSNDLDAALKKRLEQKDDRHARRSPHETGDGVTIQELSNRFLNRGFYTLRHTFRTWADQLKDQPVVDFIMGHEVPHVSVMYRDTIGNERLIDATATAIADSHRYLTAVSSPVAYLRSGRGGGMRGGVPRRLCSGRGAPAPAQRRTHGVSRAPS